MCLKLPVIYPGHLQIELVYPLWPLQEKITMEVWKQIKSLVNGLHFID